LLWQLSWGNLVTNNKAHHQGFIVIGKKTVSCMNYSEERVYINRILKCMTVLSNETYDVAVYI